eukprot:TRINITY_DN60457_c0_g1_i1.p1 TRINITY_DN60457_c0_g1~~TRINITY_DN60457_c0_g1_i1.p1  ORF type:complete len:699 (+),score=148.50 TRINITY_DN60457_c0_g1_i1:104-2200(+)
MMQCVAGISSALSPTPSPGPQRRGSGDLSSDAPSPLASHPTASGADDWRRQATTAMLTASEAGSEVASSSSEDSEAQRRGVSLCFEELCLTRSKRKVLQDCSGLLKAGRLTVILGTENSGAQELMGCLSGYITLRQGRIYANGLPIEASAYSRCVGYVSASNEHRQALTVRQTLLFSQRMRRKVRKGVQGALEARGWRLAEAVAGLQRYGSELLSSVPEEVRLRAAIAAELLHLPSVLFVEQADVDAGTGLHVMRLLSLLAHDYCMTVVVALHQPRRPVFDIADDAILLQRGQIAYYGRTGRLRQYFLDSGCHIDPHDSPSDFFLDHSEPYRGMQHTGRSAGDPTPLPTPGEDGPPVGVYHLPGNPMSPPFRDFASAWRQSQECVRMGQAIVRYYQSIVSNVTPGIPDASAPGPMRRIAELLRFRLLENLNGWKTTLSQVGTIALLGLFAGLIYSRSNEDKQVGLLNRAGMLFFILSAIMLGNIPYASVIVRERAAVLHEIASGCYTASVYFISSVIFDVAVRVSLTVMFGAIAYFLMGFDPYAENNSSKPSFGNLVVFMVLTQVSFSMIALFVGACSCNAIVAQYIMVLIFIVFVGQAGFLINAASLPRPFSYTQYCSVLRYSYESALISELGGNRSFGCTPGLTGYNQLCYTGDGYLKLQGFDDTGNQWSNCYVLGGVALGFLVLAYVATRVQLQR